MRPLLRPMDLWRSAIVRKPAAEVLREGIAPDDIVWLPDMPALAFRADPFGLWRDGRLHVFAEAFDYRTRIGRIDALTFGPDLALEDCRTVLAPPFHLSYPVVFEAEGETWMLPEAFRSGTLTLYRARRFPDTWEPEVQIPLDGPAIDATPVFHRDRWWLLYTPSRPKRARRSHLHAAWSRSLTGPWHPHPRNPLRIDPNGSRPGGTILQQGDALVLPVQDCGTTYGRAIRALRITRLDETGFEAAHAGTLEAPAWMAPHVDGLHTLSDAGRVSLVDVKRMDASLGGKTARLAGIVAAGIRR